MVKTKYNGFTYIQHAHERNLVRAQIGVQCFQREFLGPAYTVRKIANVRACR